MVLDRKYVENIAMPIMLKEVISTTHTTEYILNIERINKKENMVSFRYSYGIWIERG